MNSLTSKSKPISQFLLNPSRTLYVSLFTTSSSSSSHQNYPSSTSSRRRDEEESRNVRVSVWWDIENCGVPNGVNVFKIAHSITNAVRANGIKGPVHITGFGDIFCLTRANQEALSSTGVNLIHVPNGGKNSADRSLLVDLMYWVSQNPPPAHIFLISGDRDFAGILHKLRMSNYNILLAGREGKNTPGVLCSAASIMWHWNELAKGESLSGRHFNQPPDGPFNSWYGHYRGPLEDPYGVPEQQSCRSEAYDTSNAEQSSDSQRRPVPLAVLKQLRRIVKSHPEGISIRDLRAELAKTKVAIDKDFFGHKKFSRFLLSMPNVVKVEYCADGQFFLLPASSRVEKPVESEDVSAGSVNVNGNRDAKVTTTKNGESHSITRMTDVKPLSPVGPSTHGKDRKAEEKKVEETSEKKVEETSEKKVEETSENQVASFKDHNGKKLSDAQVLNTPEAHIDGQNSEREIGLLKRLWTKFFSRSIASAAETTDVPDRSNTSSANPKMSMSGEELSKPSNQNDIRGPAHSSSDTALIVGSESDRFDKSEASPGFIAKVISWCKFWRNESSVNTTTEQSSERPSLVEKNSRTCADDTPQSRRHELFSKDTFWSALQSFLKTCKGSDIVLNSTSREQFAERLQKEGPLVLRPLQASDISHLVDLLVSEKRWIKEFPTKNPRFVLAHPSGESSASAQPHNSTGLSSLFQSSFSLENHQLTVSGVSHKTVERSRNEILADCQKLLDELLSQHPEGFNMGIFKRDFLYKYGYALDHQQLGYPKLASLLQIMPGVKMESVNIFPDTVVYAPGIESLGLKEKSTGSDSEMSDSPRKDEDIESQWEELGPVADSNLSKQETESSVGKGNGDYEPTMSDDDEFSDEEGVEPSSSHTKAEENNQSRVNEEDSSLLQILDSWYSTKDESNPRELPPDAEDSGDSSEEETRSTGSSDVSFKSEPASALSHAWKSKPQKSYTFVAEPVQAKKDKLLDGILGSLKKSGESRMHG